jgi:hypothetical protein
VALSHLPRPADTASRPRGRRGDSAPSGMVLPWALLASHSDAKTSDRSLVVDAVALRLRMGGEAPLLSPSCCYPGQLKPRRTGMRSLPT